MAGGLAANNIPVLESLAAGGVTGDGVLFGRSGGNVFRTKISPLLDDTATNEHYFVYDLECLF